MKYAFSETWTLKTRQLAVDLGFGHVLSDRIAVIVSQGSKTRRTLARIHALGKAMQTGLNTQPFYTIELVSEKFHKLSEEEQLKVLIHELMHVPKAFGGGLVPHKGHISQTQVDKLYHTYRGRLRTSEELKND